MVAAIANYLISKNFAVKIITYDGSLQSTLPMQENIEVSSIPISSMHLQKSFTSKIKNFFADIYRYKTHNKDVKNYSYLIATDNTIATIVYYAFRNSAKKIIIWEHLSYVKITSAFWKYMRRKVYPKVYSVVALNKEEEDFYTHAGCKVKYIPNFIQQQNIKLQNPDHFIWVGLLAKEKGTQELLQLSKKIKEENQNIQIIVYGQGVEEAEIRKYILKHALQNIIVLKGLEKNVEIIYNNATALLLTSKFECFPMVILEAFSFGVPVIAFDCPTGPRNLIETGKTGFLIEENNVDAMFEKMLLLKNNGSLYKQFSEASFRESHKYNPVKIKQQWDTLLA